MSEPSFILRPSSDARAQVLSSALKEIMSGPSLFNAMSSKRPSDLRHSDPLLHAAIAALYTCESFLVLCSSIMTRICNAATALPLRSQAEMAEVHIDEVHRKPSCDASPSRCMARSHWPLLAHAPMTEPYVTAVGLRYGSSSISDSSFTASLHQPAFSKAPRAALK
eukprot:CAMPEP_0178376986 /NCGR_PEP_ID=MMETSP0689_2-20121128/3686_1 /TAXON_ID=160604 /ORGANISM="Amphidinium massartii, Strain CS-259" /LENGTH=165 /DNA_ID=CAMNT_0019997027 /DNA_START=150 /DNA_END=644 /DNA_ORIENTATION=+